MIDKPLYQNPLGGGLGNTIPNPGAGTSPRGGADMFGVSNANFNVSPPGTLKVDPQATLPGIIDNFKPKSDDPLMQGYYDSEFFSNKMTMDMVPYTFQGKDMMGSSSGASNLKKYLESIGKGDLLQFKNNDLMSVDALEKVNPPAVNPIVEGNNLMESPDNNAMIPGDTSALTPPSFSDTGIFNSPFETTGQYLTGPNQDDILGTLKNIEQGIASLGQGGMNQSSFGGFNNNFGIGSFFPPYGGMYGQ